MDIDSGKSEDSSENKESATVTPMIQIDIPVRVGTNSEPANISVNESRYNRFSTVIFLSRPIDYYFLIALSRYPVKIGNGTVF